MQASPLFLFYFTSWKLYIKIINSHFKLITSNNYINMYMHMYLNIS